jgi:predicted esterase
MKPTLILILVLLSGSAVYAQTDAESGQPSGEVIDPVVTRADATQSYAAYVPTTYSAKTPSALIYCFDPLARGKFALERFVAAAEKYGYIVVCSNNSHNGQDNETAKHIIAELENDARLRFNINPARVYVAGFSGGARLAVSLAISCGKCVAGVLAAGAGFPPNIQPTANLSFAFFGAVGVDDFNYGEMRELQAKLEGLSVTYRIDTFAGGHEWLNEETLDQALAWFNLVAMKNGTLARNDRFIDQQFEWQKALSTGYRNDGRNIDAYFHHLNLARVFPTWHDVTSFSQGAETIKRSREYRRELNAEKELISRQRDYAENIFDFWSHGESSYGSSLNSRVWVQDRIRELQTHSDSEPDNSERRLARRVLIGVLIGSIETGRSLAVQKKYRSAIPYYELALVVRPRNPDVSYELARIYALDDKKKQALQSLESAVAFGFRDLARLRTDEAFANLTKEARFQKLLLAAP